MQVDGIVWVMVDDARPLGVEDDLHLLPPFTDPAVVRDLKVQAHLAAADTCIHHEVVTNPCHKLETCDHDLLARGPIILNRIILRDEASCVDLSLISHKMQSQNSMIIFDTIGQDLHLGLI
jgi:hypothetical protein